MFTRSIALLALALTSHTALAYNEATVAMPEDVQNELVNGDDSSTVESDAVDADAKANAAAKMEEPVTSTYLKVIGRGIVNRKTHDVIALACIAAPTDGTQVPSCKTIRHVKLYAKTKQMVYVGKAIQFDHEPTEAELFKSVKEVNASVKKFKKKENSENRHLNINTVVGGIVLVAAIIVNPVNASVAWVLIPAGGIGSLYFILDQTFFPTHGVLTDVMANQDGWNWSSRPKAISNRSFKWVERYLNQ